MNFGIPEWALGVAAIIFVASIAKALGRGLGGVGRLGQGANPDHERRLAQVEEAQRQLGTGDTAELERRLGELEERLDFAERMLAKQHDAERLGPPKA